MTIQFSFSDEQRELLVQALDIALDQASTSMHNKMSIQDNRRSARAHGYGNLPKHMVAYDHRLVSEIETINARVEKLLSLRTSIAA